MDVTEYFPPGGEQLVLRVRRARALERDRLVPGGREGRARDCRCSESGVSAGPFSARLALQLLLADEPARLRVGASRDVSVLAVLVDSGARLGVVQRRESRAPRLRCGRMPL